MDASSPQQVNRSEAVNDSMLSPTKGSKPFHTLDNETKQRYGR